LAKLRPVSGVDEMLASWRGVARLAVVSNFFLPGWPRRVLEVFGLADHFAFIVDSCTVVYKKPAAEIFEAAMRQAGISSDSVQSILFVGDSQTNDVQAPRRLGMRALHFDYAERRGCSDAWSHFRPALRT
jgi:putative hydrolase of the HAD superfamily